ELRSARQADARDLLRSAGRARPGRRSAVQAGDGARENRARGRLFRLTQALPERRFLFGHRPEGDRYSGIALHGDLRRRADSRLDRAAERNGLGPGVQDRPAAAIVHWVDAPVGAVAREALDVDPHASGYAAKLFPLPPEGEHPSHATAAL